MVATPALHFLEDPKRAGRLIAFRLRRRVPFANVGLVKLPPEVDDDQAILLSDILPTAYMAVENAEMRLGNTVAIFGCGPVGQFSIACVSVIGGLMKKAPPTALRTGPALSAVKGFSGVGVF
jgi:NADPH:quinone reductase-like Zn-dependent oxidoreductase